MEAKELGIKELALIYIGLMKVVKKVYIYFKNVIIIIL